MTGYTVLREKFLPLALHRPDVTKALAGGKSPKVLAICLGGTGHLVRATAAFDAIREKIPEMRLDVLTDSVSAELIEGHPSLNQVYTVNPDEVLSKQSQWFVRFDHELNKLSTLLRKEKYNAFVSLGKIKNRQQSKGLGSFFKSLRIPLWAGRNSDGFAPYFDKQVFESSDDLLPETQIILKTMSMLGADSAPRSLNLAIDPVERVKAAEQLEGKKREWIAILPGADSPAKAWPPGRFGDVGKYLAETYGFRIALFGEKGTEQACERVKAIIGEPATDFSKTCSLRETAAMLQQMKLVVSNDSGLMHVAAAVSTPMVTLFGPTNSKKEGPWMPEDRYKALHTELACHPCAYSECPMDDWCMDKIWVSTVIEEIETLLNRSDGGTNKVRARIQ